MSKFKIGDKVSSHKSLWYNDIGTISGIIEVNEGKSLLIHVIFPETEKHYAYQQSFYDKDLIKQP